MSAALSSKSIRIFLPLSLLIVALAATGWVWSQRASLKTESVQIGMPTDKVRLSWKTFSYNEQGHFGAKTQFESLKTDLLGGSYSLHCRDGRVYAVEINFPKSTDRTRCLEIVNRITGHDVHHCEEHDDKELSMKGCEKPSEYFYFDNSKIGVQLDFAKDSKKGVARIYCWQA